MTTPTRQEIIDANNALAALVCVALSNTADPDEKDLIKTEGRAIAAVLPPKPQHTMAEVEWNDEEHYLAEAHHPYFGKVIMLGEGHLSGYIRITRIKRNNAPKHHALWQTVEPETLTPTGKRYTLTETTNA